MGLTYEEFKKRVPKETATFVSSVLPYLEGYLKEDVVLRFKGEHRSDNMYSKTNFLLLYCLSEIKEYGLFLKKYGFDPSKYKINNEWVTKKGNEDEMFDRWSRFFNIYSDETFYEGLNPLDIALKAFENYASNCNLALFDYLFPSVDYRTFKAELDDKRREKKLELEQDLERKIYGNLSISVVSYLETASKLRTLLFENISNNQEIVRLTEEDIVPMSLLMALYYYKDTVVSTDEQVAEQEVIQKMLQEKGVTQEKIMNAIGINFYQSTVRDTAKNLFALDQLYTRYYKIGAAEGIADRDITVAKILDNVFDRSFTNSLAVEKMFAKLNCYVGIFIPVEETVEKMKETQERANSMSYVKSFYSELPKDTKDFIEFTAKAYLVILEKMKEKNHNIDILVDEDDADTLALFIASYFYDTDVSEFFKDYGVTLEKVLDFFKLQISKEEIEGTKLNQRVLVDRYKRFVYDGVNRSRSAKTIKMNDISHNLCNRDFNRSMIMENIFEELVRSTNLQSDFLNQLKAHLEKKEQNRKMRLTQRLFKDMPSSTMEYLENVSRIHQYIISLEKPYSEADIQVFSLLLGILSSSKNEMAGFFDSKKLTIKMVCNYLGITPEKLLKENTDIDILVEQYGVFIFGGKNKGLERKDLTISNIARNIFEKSVHNSVLISKFLGSFGLSYENFQNLDAEVQDYLEKTEEKRKKEEGTSLLSSFRESAREYIENVLCIHKRLERIAFQDETVARLIPNITDIRELSMLLGMFTVNNDVRYFFEKNKVTLDNICSLIGIQSNILSNLRSEEIDYRLVHEVYGPFIKYGNSNFNKDVSDLISRVFDKSVGIESLVLEEIVSFVGSNYDILEEEVLKRRDHELSLTIDDRIKVLSEEEIDPLDLSDVKSILHFGNSLSIHSKYIHDELPRLMMSDAHDKSVQALSQIANRVYTKVPAEPKKRSLFQRLFAISVEENPKVVLNAEAIQELKESIDVNIEALSKELLGYDSIRRYIEIYRRKNRSHLIVAMSETESLEQKVQGLSPEKEDEYADFLTATSRLQIMRDKSNRFSTSNHLMKQELLKVNQAIVNHFITINALEMARDDLLPLIGSELALTQGRNTENKGLELSENIIGLFQSLLSRNVISAVENMERLKQSSLPSETFALLNKDIEVYLRGLNQAGEIEKRVESLDIDQVSTIADYTPKLELTGASETTIETARQKIKEFPKE